MRFIRLRRELVDEIEAHIAERVDELMEGGMAEQEARQSARREFGNATLYAEISREAWGWTRLERISKDFRHALRTLRASPLFTVTAVLSLALGIGANTAIFTLLYASLWRPLPVQAPRQIFQLVRASPGNESWEEYSYSYPLFQQLSESAHTAHNVGEVFAKGGPNSQKFGVDGASNERVAGEAVSANFFSALRVQPLLGRVFQPQDDSVLGGNHVAVLSRGFWTRRFQSNPSILGKTILYNETPYTVVGVTQPGFTGVDAEASIDVWVPVTSSVDKGWLTDPNVNWLRPLVRLRPGAVPAKAQAMFEGVFRAHLADKLLPDASPHWKPVLASQHLTLRPAYSGVATTGRKYEKPLLVLLGLVAVVLLIACGNVANLILERNASRQREITLRLALGASRGRIVSQLFTESLLLAVAGAACGVLLAAWGTRLLISFLPQASLPLAFDLQPGLVVLGFTACTAIVTAMLFGLGPAVRACIANADLSLRGGPRVTGPSLGGRLLVAGQLALSLLLLIGAGLFLSTLRNLKTTDLGFRPEHVVTLDLSFPKATPEDRVRQTYVRIKERLESHAGVMVASYAWPSIYGHGGWSGGIEVEGHTAEPGEDNDVGMIAAGPGFFESIGLGLLQGRYLNLHDQTGKPPVAVVNESFARHYFGSSPAVGRRIKLAADGQPQREIVGVVRDARHYGVREKTWRMVYVPGWKVDGGFFIRANLNAQLLSDIVRAEVTATDKIAHIERIRPFEMDVNDMVSQERLTAALSSVFGALAVVLAAVGLYGVVAYGISRRINEFGIRMALGAQRGDVQRLVLRQTIPLIMAGVGAGVVGAVTLAHILSAVISGMLYGVKPGDIAVFAGSTLLLAAVALLAALLPARRASRIDPMIALRYE
jgi:putative ABC transport system permease protein